MSNNSSRLLLAFTGAMLLITSIGYTIEGVMPSGAYSFQTITAALLLVIIAWIGVKE